MATLAQEIGSVEQADHLWYRFVVQRVGQCLTATLAMAIAQSPA
jgi:hypothetical protein